MGHRRIDLQTKSRKLEFYHAELTPFSYRYFWRNRYGNPYLLGQTHGQTSPVSAKGAANEAIDWILIPPRARDTLWSMTFIQDRIPSRGPDQLLRYADGPKIRWRFIRSNGLSHDHSVADGSVRPLIKLGLLVALEDNGDLFELTESGLATTKEYWRRYNANDPGLPVMSMR